MSSNRRGLRGFALNLWRAVRARHQNISTWGGGGYFLPTRSPERLLLAAFVCLLVVAAGLRFYNLPEGSVSHDEAVAANNSRGALSEVVSNTRHRNSSPILYPLALWAVQKVDVSAFSVRVLPAASSVLTVAALLFLLPRAGVARWAAFLAALLATLSIAAIEHAQDAREYSIDALLAVLMVAGLLWYLRDGRKALLCVALFLAPLLQYGLVLFGAAVIGAAIVLPPPSTLAAPEQDSYISRIRNWLERRIALVLPAACFLAGCAISYVVTLIYQWREWGFASDGYLAASYYPGGFDAPAIFEFSIERTWSLLTYHLPEVVTIAALASFAILLAAAFIRKFSGQFPGNAITVLFTICIAVSVGAAVLSIYPLGGIRQNLYLGPVIFLAAGVSIHWTADSLAALTRRAWLAPALAVAAAGTIALAGVGAMRQDSPYVQGWYEKGYNAKAVLAFLEENVEEGDMVYANMWTAPSMKFYQDVKPSNYHYAKVECWRDFGECIREMLRLAVSRPNVPDRIFLVHGNKSILEELGLLGELISVELVTDGDFNVSLIANVKESIESAYKTFVSAYEAVVSGEPAIRSDWDVYLSENTLVYVK